jgi:hypothetical protein
VHVCIHYGFKEYCEEQIISEDTYSKEAKWAYEITMLLTCVCAYHFKVFNQQRDLLKFNMSNIPSDFHNRHVLYGGELLAPCSTSKVEDDDWIEY